MPSHPAEDLIADLGIAAPREIDVEAIAYDAGVEVRYEVLNGCAATLVGVRGRAIATIQLTERSTRQRFSIGHELGHWHHHRGQSFRCRVDDVSMNLGTAERAKEREADAYSANLLMPGQLFKPRIKEIRTPSMADLGALASDFDCGLLSTALRLIDVNTVPAILTCYDRQGLRWERRTPDVPRRWYLKQQLDEDSFAFDLLDTGKPEKSLRKSAADTWFTNDDGHNYEVREHSAPMGSEVLTLILPEDSMLEAGFDPDAFPTKYNQNGAYTARRPIRK